MLNFKYKVYEKLTFEGNLFPVNGEQGDAEHLLLKAPEKLDLKSSSYELRSSSNNEGQNEPLLRGVSIIPDKLRGSR